MPRLDWAIAVALALTTIAKKEKRDLYIFTFTTEVDKEMFYFEKGRTTPEDIMRLASVGTSGGTDFMKPLGHALSVLESDPNFKDADILFITDGECGVTPDWLKKWNEAKKRLQFKTHSILTHHAYSRALDSVSEEIMAIGNMRDADKTYEMTFTI